MRDASLNMKQTRFNQIFAIASIFSLPIVVLGSIFGMNLEDLPISVPFYPALGATLTLSMILIMIFVIISCIKVPESEEDPAITTARASLSLEFDRFQKRVSLENHSLNNSTTK